MIKSFGVVGCLGGCQDCKWEITSYKNGQALAAQHARRYGHRVELEITNYGVYDGRADGPKLKR